MGANRLVSISTAAVYGAGPHSGADPRVLTPRPQTPRSRSRLAGDAFILDAGGLVLRPNFLYGAGDRWFLPALASLPPGVFSEGEESARISAISVLDFAAVVAHFATRTPTSKQTSYVVAAPQPLLLRDLLQVTAQLAVGRQKAPQETRPLSRHERDLVSSDNWFDVRPLWDEIGLRAPGAGLQLSAHDLAWYRAHLSKDVGD